MNEERGDLQKRNKSKSEEKKNKERIWRIVETLMILECLLITVKKQRD